MNNAIVTLNVLSDFMKIKRTIHDSRLSQQEKETAYNCLSRVKLCAKLSIVIISVLAIFSTIISVTLVSEDNVAAMIGIPLGISITTFIVYGIVMFNIMKPLKKLLKKIEYGFDGTNNNDPATCKIVDDVAAKMASLAKRKAVMWALLMVASIILAVTGFCIIGSFLMTGLGIAFTVVCSIRTDSYNVDCNRLKSKYYDGLYKFGCMHCGNSVGIPFTDLEKYENDAKSKGVFIKCDNCGNLVKFSNIDVELKDYRNYLNKRAEFARKYNLNSTQD